ncbi:MAG: MurR/RpiR family transcriptional regulator [Comamonas sp.]
MTDLLQKRSEPPSLRTRLAAHAGVLTGSERTLAEVLARDYPQVLLEPATALAQRTGTSASTVVRLFAKLGYASYAEAQREARGAASARLNTAAQRVAPTLGAERDVRQCVEDAWRHDERNLAATREAIDWAVFEAVVALLADEERRLWVFAQKNSAPVAAWLALQLNMCRPQVAQLGAGGIVPTDQLLWVRPGDVLLAFSVRRYSAGPIHVARQFGAAGGVVAAIADSPTAPVVAHADHALYVHTDNASPFDSYTAAFFLGNALVSAVAQRRRAAVGQALRRRDALWADIEGDPAEGLR